MQSLANPFRGRGFGHPDLDPMPWTADDPSPSLALVARCPRAARTPLLVCDALAHAAGVGAVWIKDERNRMGLGSFKALGAAHVIARDAERGAARGRTYVAASAGNHGLSVAAGARAFGAQARIYIARTVPEAFARRLRAEGAEVVRAGDVYEESMDEAARAAEAEGLVLLSDSSWPGYADRPHCLMEGYLILMAEAVDQVPTTPTHIFLQAGVGGLAAAAAAHARRVWGDGPRILVVEPQAAPALAASIAAEAPVTTEGPVSAMGRLDCKAPSLIALKSLARDADDFLTLSEEEGAEGARVASASGFETTPSGAAGLAGLLAARGGHGLDEAARVLVILSEGPERA